MRAVDIDDFDLSRLTRCIARQKGGKWREYADDEWFRRHDAECEKRLSDFFGAVRTIRSCSLIMPKTHSLPG